MRHAFTPTLVSLLAIAACEAAGTDVYEGGARDSAGIHIVGNTTGVAVSASRWIIADQPLLEIGAADDASAFQFHDVAGVVRLEDGSLVVANAGTHAVRFYDPSGRHLQTIGRRGGGPGEFEQIESISNFAEDSVAVWDLRQVRLSVFDSQGNFIRMAHPYPAPSGSFPPMYGMFEDGSFVLGRGLNIASVFEAGGGLSRDSVVMLRYAPDGRFMDTLGIFPGSEKHAQVGTSGFSIRPVPFGRQTHIVTGDHRIYVATGDTYEIVALSDQGEPDLIIRKQYTAVPVDQRAVSVYREAQLASVEAGQRPREEHRLAELPYPEVMAPYTGLKTDEVGNVWVREQLTPSAVAPAMWAIFGSDGAQVAIVETPSDFTIHDAGEDWIAGVYKDDFDIEYVRVYQLRK